MDKRTLKKSFDEALKEAITKHEREVKEGKSDFNLFNALGVSERETYHSAFLGYLLSPDSDHYQSIFLEEFLSKILDDEKDFSGIKAENVKWVKAEYTLKSQRRIDLLIACKDDVYILIENKIYAEDQRSQIRDYVSDLLNGDRQYNNRAKAKKVFVIYLTPFEDHPSQASLKEWKIQGANKICDKDGREKAHYFKMDYGWIREWLEECLKKITKDSKNLVGESTKGENGLDKVIFGINQYLEILKKINGEYEERNEILEVIEKPEYRQFALDIYRNESKYYGEIEEVWDKFSERVVREFCDKLERFLNEEEFSIVEGKERWRVIQRLESGRKLDSCGLYRLMFLSETYYSENIWIGLNFFFESSNYGCPSIIINTLFDDEDEEEEMRREKISIGQKAIIADLSKSEKDANRLRYYKSQYWRENFLDLEDGENLVSWIIERGEDSAVKEFLDAVRDFANNSIISKAYNKLDQLIAENPRK